MSDHRPDGRARKAVRRMIEATDRAIDSLEELKRARAALSLEAARDDKPLKLVRADEEGRRDGP
jgi:hypothetical protein